MAMVKCAECGREISEQATKCPNCGVRHRTPRRGAFGLLVKGTFIAFNIGMIAFTLNYCAEVAPNIQALEMKSEAARAGAGLGLAVGVTFIAGIWLAGFVILGGLTLMTRPRD